MSFDRGKIAAAAVLAATVLVVGGVTGYGLHRAGAASQTFEDDGRLKVMASFYPITSSKNLFVIFFRSHSLWVNKSH